MDEDSMVDAAEQDYLAGLDADGQRKKIPPREGTGLFSKYVVHRRQEEDTMNYGPDNEVPWPSFVLRIDGEDSAALEALRTYALATEDDDLAFDIARELGDATLSNHLYLRRLDREFESEDGGGRRG